MEFKVIFYASSWNPAIELKPKSTGLRVLDDIREKLEAPELDPGKVNSQFQATSTNPILVLTENQARQSGHFDNQNEVEIKVKPESLNKFCYESHRADRDSQGAIRVVRPVYELDKKALVESWFNAGCPLEWKIE